MNLKQKALYLAFATAVISGLSVFFNSFATKVITNSNVLTTAKNILVALILSLVILTPTIIKKLSALNLKDWRNLFLIGIIGGSIPFLLFFKGLSLTSPVNAGFIHKTLFIWVALLAVPFLKEKLSKIQWLALAILLIGNYFLVGLKSFSFSTADLLILGATLMWAVEFVIAKKILKNIDFKIVSWARMFLGAIILLGYLIITKQAGALFALNLNQWSWLAISSIFLLGYVLTWYQALQKLPATLVTSVLVIASPITTALNALFITHKYSLNQGLSSLVLIIAASLFVYAFSRINKTESATV